MLSTTMVTLTGRHQRSFHLWFTQVSTTSELQSLIQPPHGLITDCIIQQPDVLQAILRQPLSAVLLSFSPASLLLHSHDLRDIGDRSQLPGKVIDEAARGFTHLLVRPSLLAEFGFGVHHTNLYVHETDMKYLPATGNLPEAIQPANSRQLIAAIKEQQDGEGLRSHYPYAYVWYHDLLYMVTKISIPGFAASRACDPQVLDACGVLQESGFRPKSVEALYPRPFLSSIYQTTAKHTWFGIRLAQNYCQYRHPVVRLSDNGR